MLLLVKGLHIDEVAVRVSDHVPVCETGCDGSPVLTIWQKLQTDVRSLRGFLVVELAEPGADEAA